MRIGLDAMGGDYAPKAVVEGAILAQKELSKEDKIVLFGRSVDILQILKDNGVDSSLFEIVEASQVIDMHDKPAKAFVKKPDSSMGKGFQY